jgi:hypothetical protein
LLILISVALPIIGLHAQEKNDTTGNAKIKEKPLPLAPYHRNVIKFNPTPMLIQGVEIRNLTFSYERLIKKNQSISLQAGYLVFPRLISDTVFNLINIQRGTKYGVNLALDYRYYPFQRNRRPAPDGIYIGGYVAYYGFQFRNDFNIIDTSVVQNGYIKGNMNIIHLGVELGYQFVFWKRFTLDLLLFGPSLGVNSGSLTIGGNLDPELVKGLDEDLVNRLTERFPLIKSLVSGEDLKFTGTRTKVGIGFRYSIQLGFHF